MAASPQLRLVQDAPPQHGTTQDPVRQVFEHWVYMFGLMPARTKLDAERKLVIAAALDLYEGCVPMIMMAVEGMAAVPLGDKPESMQEAMREITWFLASAKRIENALRWRDRLQLMANKVADGVGATGPALPAPEATPEERAAARAAKERLRELAVRGREGGWFHG
jgi:hypothetical protein